MPSSIIDIVLASKPRATRPETASLQVIESAASTRHAGRSACLDVQAISHFAVGKGSHNVRCYGLGSNGSRPVYFVNGTVYRVTVNSEEPVRSDHHHFGLEPERTNSKPGQCQFPSPDGRGIV
jgi:hypothetical protein